MSSKNHERLKRKKEAEKAKQRWEDEMKTINQEATLVSSERDITSMRYRLTPLMEITKSDTLSDYYRELLTIYRQDNYRFTLKNAAHFAFNPFALIFGVLYMGFSRLYMGLFFNIMLLLVCYPLVMLIPYATPLTVFALGHIFCAITANFFIVHKAVHELDKEIVNPRNVSEYDILRTVYLRHTTWRVFHMMFSSVYVAVILYLVLVFISTDFSQGWLSGFTNAASQTTTNLGVQQEQLK